METKNAILSLFFKNPNEEFQIRNGINYYGHNVKEALKEIPLIIEKLEKYKQ